MKRTFEWVEWVVFILYCAMPISLVVGFFAQNGTIFMLTVYSFVSVYFLYGILRQQQMEEI